MTFSRMRGTDLRSFRAMARAVQGACRARAALERRQLDRDVDAALRSEAADACLALLYVGAGVACRRAGGADLDACRVDAERDQLRPHGIGALLGKIEVVLRLAERIGMPGDADGGGALQLAGEL